MSESLQSAAEAPLSPTTSERSVAWAQFPRRVILLLIAFSIASFLITSLRGLLSAGTPAFPQGQVVNWEISWRSNQPVADVIAMRMPNTLQLLGTAFGLALLLATIVAYTGALLHQLEEASNPLGTILKWLGRLGCLVPAALPVVGLSLFLVFFFAFQLRFLPGGGKISPGGGGLSDVLQHLILPSFTLAFLPGVIAAQEMARVLKQPQATSNARTWMTRLFKLLGLLLGQIGGWLTAIIVVETVFSWPGLGRLAFDAAITRDYPVLLGVLGAFAGVILGGRLAAEFFRWLERLVRVPAVTPQTAPSPWRKLAQRLWVAFTLLLLIVPLVLVVTGLSTDAAKTLNVDLQARNAPPSTEHPWGADSLGRDLQARVLLGGLTMLKITVLAAVIALIPSLLGGALTGFLASHGRLWSESLADLVLLPADVLLFIPALAGVMVFMLIGSSEERSWLWLVMGVVGVLLPRALRFYQTLWTTEPKPRRWLVLVLIGSGALLLGMIFAALGLVAAVDFMGIGIQPPQPSIGTIIADTLSIMTAHPTGLFAAGGVLWACSAAFYLSADALVGFFDSKEPLSRLNE